MDPKPIKSKPPTGRELGEFGSTNLPYGDAPPDRFKLAAMYEPILSAEDQQAAAALRAERALEGDDPAEHAEARAHLAAARERRHEVRLDWADFVMGGLRIAAKERASDLAELLGSLLLADVRADIDRIADAVAALMLQRRASR
jgi:hypothetical protein